MPPRRLFPGWQRARPGLGPLAGLAAALSTLLQLLTSPVLGLANNGDYHRILLPLGMAPVIPPGQPPSFQYIWLKYAPAPALKGGYWSTEYQLVHVVRRASVMLGFGPVFDLRLMGIAHAILLGLAVWLIVRALPGSLPVRAITALLLVIVITDTRFTVYLDSFYEEPASLLALLFLIAAVLHAWRRPSLSAGSLVAVTVAAAALTVAKTQDSVLAFPIAAMLLVRRVEWPRLRLAGRWRGRIPGAICAIMLCVLGALYLHTQPAGLARNNRYNAVFVELLGYSHNPAADLKSLGLSPELAKYAGIPIYAHNNATHDPHFAGFFSKITEVKLAEFYLTHPGRMIALAHRGATASMHLKPYGVSPPLGNQTLASGAPPYYSACKLCLYSTVSESWQSASGVLLPALWLAALAAALALIRIGEASVRRIAAVLLLLLVLAIVSMAVALLGEGEYEIVKHLYLTSACNGLLAVFTIQAAGLLVSHRRRARAGAAISEDESPKARLNTEPSTA